MFGVTGRELILVTSRGRSLRTFRTEVPILLWTGMRFGPLEKVCLWDTAADLLTVSERFARGEGIPIPAGAEALSTSGISGSVGGVLVPLTFRFKYLPGVTFRAECQILLGSSFPHPLLGNHFVRRNFNVEARGERRTYFRLRDPAPDAVPGGRPGGP
jgi:hypothetical protein